MNEAWLQPPVAVGDLKLAGGGPHKHRERRPRTPCSASTGPLRQRNCRG